MGSAKHESALDDLERAYEPNEIGLGAIIKFTIGLVILIVVTFGLMWVFYGVLEQNAVERFGPPNPMAMSDTEKLPPEPRLQSAPGFYVDTTDGRVNLELTIPQSEYRVLHKEWDDQIKHGQKHPVTGTLISMPIEDAKAVYLGMEKKAKSGAEVDTLAKDSQKYISDASSGRMASESRR